MSAISRSRSARSHRPSHHANDAGTAFRNPWPSAAGLTLAELVGQPFPVSWASSLSALQTDAKAHELAVVQPDWGRKALVRPGEGEVRAQDSCLVGTWLGHASAFVQVPLEGTQGTATAGGPTRGKKKLCVLFDPIFSARAGPTQWMGPRRFRDSPCQVADLPGCDAVFISHNHYDHLDLSSVQALLKRFPKARYFVPLGNKQWLVETGVPADLVLELDWWDVCEFGPEDFGHKLSSEAAEIEKTWVRVSCVPAQHNSGRVGMDGGSSLWSGWAVEQFVSSTVQHSDREPTSTPARKGSVYHAGDTGYRRSAKSDVVCPAFKEIGEKLGPFDLSFVPIWRGGTLGFISSLGLRLAHDGMPSTLHGSPTDAVSVHLDVRSKNTIGIHFGTFVGSDNETYEAIIEFGQACEEQGVRSLADHVEGTNGRAGTLDIGASLAVEIE